MDVRATFAHDGVIHADDHRRAGRQMFEQRFQRSVKQHGLVHPVLGIEPVVGGPVLVLAAAGADEVRHGAVLGDEQGGEHVLGQTLGAGVGGGCRGGGAKQLVEPLAQELRAFVFFSTATGLGGTSRRERMRLPLSATIHSTVSPLVNSMAWATAEGKLM
jgi:hypothetical protein